MWACLDGGQSSEDQLAPDRVGSRGADVEGPGGGEGGNKDGEEGRSHELVGYEEGDVGVPVG